MQLLWPLQLLWLWQSHAMAPRPGGTWLAPVGSGTGVDPPPGARKSFQLTISGYGLLWLGRYGAGMEAGPVSLAAALLESDRAYFEAGAEVRDVPGAAMALLRGMEALAAACVVHRVRQAEVGEPERWLGMMGREVRAAGCAALRIYLDEPTGPLAATLARTGAMRTVEVGLVRRSGGAWPGGAVPPGMTLDPVRSADAWRAKLDFHRACPVGPDGHAAPAELWVAMERRRAGAGYLRPWLVRLDGTVCGTFGLAGQGQLARLKNVVLHPGFRGRGLARHVVRLAADSAAGDGALGVGCFALERHHALAMYQALGFEPVIRQYEWVAPLAAPRPRHNLLMKAGT